MKEFVEENKALLVAPAGYGKTYTIANCLKYTSGTQLILTHTHAGISSIKSKLSQLNIPNKDYNVETISGFSQKYVEAFYIGELPNQDDRNYHNVVSEKAVKIFSNKIVLNIIKNSYTGLFVDEYQDCSVTQHKMILALAEAIPTRILGDHLQSIYDFNGRCVDLETELLNFKKFPDLETPNRWYSNGNNKYLGDLLKNFRENLLRKQAVKLKSNHDKGFYVIIANEDDIMNAKSNYRLQLDKVISNRKNLQELESLLILVPEYDEEINGKHYRRGTINDRSTLKNQIDYSNSLTLLEAIDDKLFYSVSKKADELIQKIGRAIKKNKRIREDILDVFFNTTSINLYLKDDVFISKRDSKSKALAIELVASFDEFINSPSPLSLLKILLILRKKLKFKTKRSEVFQSFINALKISSEDKISIFEAMKLSRNVVRRTGRKIHGKCLGTTLLTKGLEFDTVVLLDAHRFKSPNHLYVALTRCCKKLIVFSNTDTLTPNY